MLDNAADRLGAIDIAAAQNDDALFPYGQLSKAETVSNVVRPITSASTLAMYSSYPCGSPPPPAESQ